MSDQNSKIDLFALGQQHFAAFIKEFASYGVAADPDLELLPGTGLLCYYSLEDRRIYLSVPDFNNPLGKLQLLFLRSLLGCESDEELLSFFRLFIPHVIAHELAHHFRHRYGLFDQDSLWHEEQIANKLSVAVVKHRLSPQEKQSARTFLRRAIEALSTQMEEKNIATDSYHSILHALDVSGQIDASDFERLELIQTATGISAEDMLKGSGQLSGDLLERLENRDDLIDEIDEQYASDQIKYIYYHVGWLYLDLTSRETEYVDEFARNYLNLGVDLLPLMLWLQGWPVGTSIRDTAPYCWPDFSPLNYWYRVRANGYGEKQGLFWKTGVRGNPIHWSTCRKWPLLPYGHYFHT
jgi:hypothetical protein